MKTESRLDGGLQEFARAPYRESPPMRLPCSPIAAPGAHVLPAGRTNMLSREMWRQRAHRA